MTQAVSRAPTRSAAPLPMPPELRDATTTPEVVTVPERTVLALDGEGAPEGQTFQRSVAAVYGIAYTLKFARKKARRPDFKIGPLEGRWWTGAARSAWRWQLRMAVPKDVTEAELVQSIADATHKKGGKLEASREAGCVTLARLPATRCGRVLHVGPYAKEGESFERMAAALGGAGLLLRKAHVEVYLSDPGRTKPDKLKTVLLVEVA